ncbi:MAG: hypothetical protein MH204_01965 [Fimbriimonadaceae bacterium]|nr:hypothetical protein [Fimbriimonadaceae bacterium]
MSRTALIASIGVAGTLSGLLLAGCGAPEVAQEPAEPAGSLEMQARTWAPKEKVNSRMQPPTQDIPGKPNGENVRADSMVEGFATAVKAAEQGAGLLSEALDSLPSSAGMPKDAAPGAEEATESIRSAMADLEGADRSLPKPGQVAARPELWQERAEALVASLNDAHMDARSAVNILESLAESFEGFSAAAAKIREADAMMVGGIQALGGKVEADDL